MQGAGKVGLLVVVFAGLLIGAYALLGRSLFAPEPNIYYAKFADAGGTATGTKVLMAGVQIGQVESVALTGPKSALMRLAINKDIVIPEGSRAVLPSSFIGFGDNPIQIEAPEVVTGAVLRPGSTMAGVKTSAIENLLPDSKETIKNLNKALAATTRLLEDQKVKNSFTNLMETGEKTVNEFGLLAQQARLMMAENRASIQRVITTASLAAEDVRKSTKLLTQMLADPRLKDQALSILDKLNATAAKADDLVASIHNLVNDPKLREPLNNVMANADKISASGTRIAEDAEKIAKNTEKITANGITISEEAITLAKKANEIADEAKEVLQKIKGFFDRTPGAGGVKPLEVGMDLLRETRPNYWRTDINATFGVPGSGTSYHVGLFDAFESNRITVQLGRNIGGANEVRYGIYASKPGVGVDSRLTPKLQFRGDLFDINDPRLDLRLRYDFGNGIIGWAGVDRAFSGNSPVIGIGVRK